MINSRSRVNDVLVKSLALFVLVAIFAWPVKQQIGGDWKGQVLDRETGQPLEGVVVLLTWERCHGAGWHGCYDLRFYDVDEAVTDTDGRFVIARRLPLRINPFLRGPYLHVFKPGYGNWNLRGYTTWGIDQGPSAETMTQFWQGFKNDGMVIDLPPLKSTAERHAFYWSVGGGSLAVVPKERRTQWDMAESMERQFLGLP